MATVTDIRAGMAARLSTIPGLRAYPVVLDQILTPCAFVFGPDRIRFDVTAARGCDEFTIPVRVYVGRVAEKDAQRKLDAYVAPVGDQSFKEALEADPSLGGVVDFADLREVRNYGPYQSGDAHYLGAEFVITVIARP